MSAVVISTANALNAFSGKVFRAYPGAATPTQVDTTMPWVTVRETDREEEGMTSDPLDVLYSSYVELYVSAKDNEDLAAVERAILSRQRQVLGVAGQEIQYLMNEVETVGRGTVGRYESVIELKVWWAASYA